MYHLAGAPSAPDGGYDADIVILSLDRADETIAAIASSLAQRGCTRHVWVVDQGSSMASLRRLIAAVAGREDATLVALSRNHGVAGGRNHGSAMGHGRVIIALDNDAEFAAPDTAASMIAALDTDPALAVIGCRIVAFDGGRDDLSSWGYPAALLPHAAEAFESVTYVGAGHAIRRAAWDDAGGYDGALFFCWEEYDFALRAIARGWRLRYRGDIVIRHKVAAEHRVRWPGHRWYYFVRNRLYIGRKHGDSWLSLAPRAAGYFVRGLRNGLALDTARAVIAAARMVPPAPLEPLPRPALEYLRRHDTAWRGSWFARLGREVCALLPEPPPLPRQQR